MTRTKRRGPHVQNDKATLRVAGMLLTIKSTHKPATDLGFLLHKHPDHVHTREFPVGNATVFYPEATEGACTAALALDVDPIGIVRGRGGTGGAEDQYVNDCPYVASSLPLGRADAVVQFGSLGSVRA